jgi:hypothetical protein
MSQTSNSETAIDGVIYDSISRRLVKKPKIAALTQEIDFNFDVHSVRNKGNFFTSDPAVGKRRFEENFAIHDVEARQV